MKLKHALIATLSVLCLVVASSVVVVTMRSGDGVTTTDKELQLRIDWVEKCQTDPVVVSIKNIGYKNSHEGRTNCSIQSFGVANSFGDVELMLNALKEASQKSDVVRAICHDIVHNVGVEAWRSFGNRSLIYNHEDCGMGYYHGLMSVALEGTDSKSSRVLELNKFCADYPVRDKNHAQGVRSYCVHGIGHAIGGQVDTLQEAFELCGNVFVTNPGDDRNDCFGGALNQYLVIKKPQGTADGQQRKLCGGFTERALLECTKYAVYTSSATSSELTSYCAAMQVGVRRAGCYSAIGMTASHKELFGGDASKGLYLRDNPKEFAAYIENLCAGDVSNLCVRQLISEVSEQILNPDQVMKTCNAFKSDVDSITCRNNVNILREVQTLS